MDNYQASTTSGTKIDLYTCNGGSAQQWTLNSSGELVNTASGLCLNDSGYGGSGTGLIQYTCTGTSNETWSYNSSTEQYVLQYDGLCVNDPGNITTDGTQLIIYACGDYSDEQWSAPGGTPPPPAGVITGYGGLCVDNYHSSTSSGTKIDLYTCNGSNAQQWTLNGSRELVNAVSGLCLNDSGYGGSGTGLIQYTCTGTSNETWTYNSSAEYVLGYNGLCLNDPGDSTTAGTQLIIYACQNTANEHWSAPTSPSTPTNVAFSPDYAGDAESLTPTFSAVYSDTAGSSGYDQFQVLDSSGTVVASGNGSTVSSGGTSTWTPGSQLQTGDNYQIEARASYGGAYSAWSAPVSFYVDPRLAFGVHPWSTYVSIPLDAWTTVRTDVASGDLNIATTGLSLPGAGLPFNLSFWNSSHRDGAPAEPQSMAWNWTDSLSATLAANADGSVTYFEPSGGTATFTSNGSGGYNTPGSVDATLASVSGGGWTLTWHSSGSTHAQGEVDTFNSSGQLTKQAAASGEAITISYNSSSYPTQVTDTEGRVIDLSYDSSGDLTEVDDTASGRTWTFGYTSGALSSITDPAGKVTSFTADTGGNGDTTAVTSPSGRTIDIAYNSSGQVSTLTQQGGSNPQWSFTYGSNTTSVKDPNGNTTTYTWDNADRVTKTTDPLGQSQSKTWTPDNNVASVTDSAGNVTAFTWNATTDVLEKETMPTGATTSYTYGDSSNPYVPTKITDPQGNSISYSYDSYGQPTQITDGLSSQNSATITYQGQNSVTCGAQNGEPCSTTNPDGSKTSYGYNSSGQLTSITPPTPLGKKSFTYDPDGNPTQITDGRGDTTTYTWNNLDELTKISPASGEETSYGYDSDGDLTSRSGAAGSESFTWDSLGRLASSVDADNATTTYSYDAIGNLTSINDPAGTTNYTYNQVNEPTSIADPWGGTTNLSYTSGHDTWLATIAFPNGVSQSFSYDKSGRMTSLDATTSSTTLIKQNYSYTTSSGGDTALLQTQTDTAGDTTSYGYDAVDRLTSATTKNPSGATTASYSYGYDGAGNMTSQTVNGTTTNYSYNAASELTSQGASYDAAGNLTGGAGFSSLTYNAGGQTASVTPSGGTAADFSYVGASQDQLDQAGNTSMDTTALGISTTSDTTTGTDTYYAYTPQGGLVAEHTGGNTYYYLLGRLGSVLGLTDSGGNLVDHYTYDPYGQQTAVTNGAPNLFGFDGGLQLPGTGLIHFGARYYDSSLGQWTQPDPTGQSPGYTYASDNPVNYTDLTGTLGPVSAYLLVGGSLFGAAESAISVSEVFEVAEGTFTLSEAVLVGAAATGILGGIFVAGLVACVLFC